MKLFLLALLSVSVVASYNVDPAKCSNKIEDSYCYFQGTTKARQTMIFSALFSKERPDANPDGTPTADTCIQCLIKSPDIASWGCTLAEMLRWCELGFDNAPPDIGVAGAPGPWAINEPEQWFKAPKFKATHKVELKKLKHKMHTGLADWATLLAKFDLAHPDFTQEESKIMDGIVNQNESPAQVKTSLSSAELADSWQTYLKENGAFLKENSDGPNAFSAFLKGQTTGETSTAVRPPGL
jgi:hypothetical protein